jgi:hypothetical protein
MLLLLYVLYPEQYINMHLHLTNHCEIDVTYEYINLWIEVIN